MYWLSTGDEWKKEIIPRELWQHSNNFPSPKTMKIVRILTKRWGNYFLISQVYYFNIIGDKLSLKYWGFLRVYCIENFRPKRCHRKFVISHVKSWINTEISRQNSDGKISNYSKRIGLTGVPLFRLLFS